MFTCESVCPDKLKSKLFHLTVRPTNDEHKQLKLKSSIPKRNKLVFVER